MNIVLITSCNKNYYNFFLRLYNSCRKNSPDTHIYCDFVSTCDEDSNFFKKSTKEFKKFSFNITTLHSSDIILPKHLHTNIASEMFFKLSGSIANCLKHIHVNKFLNKYDYVASIDADNIINSSIENYLFNNKTVADIYCKYVTVNYTFLKEFVEKKKSTQTKYIYDSVFCQVKLPETLKLLKESFYIVKSTELSKVAFNLIETTFTPFMVAEKIGIGVPALMLTLGLNKTKDITVVNDDQLLTYNTDEKGILCTSGYLLNKYKLK